MAIIDIITVDGKRYYVPENKRYPIRFVTPKRPDMIGICVELGDNPEALWRNQRIQAVKTYLRCERS